MEVAPYNEGRTVANVSTKSWVDGNSERLRPDTMWADDRYVDITQKEINEAKLRVAERKSRKAKKAADHHDDHGHDHGHGHDSHDAHHYDWKHISVAHEPALYP